MIYCYLEVCITMLNIFYVLTYLEYNMFILSIYMYAENCEIYFHQLIVHIIIIMLIFNTVQINLIFLIVFDVLYMVLLDIFV